MMTQFYTLNNTTLTCVNDLMENRAFAYGDGFFSTLGVRSGKILWQNEHKARLVFSAKQFMLTIDIEAIMASLQLLAKQITEGILKIIITRTNQALRGYGFEGEDSLIFIKSCAAPIYNNIDFIGYFPIQATGEACLCTQNIGIRSSRFGGLKLISSHEQIFVHHEFLQKKQHNQNLTEALVKNIYGEIVSGTSSNVYYQLNKHWYTPFVRTSGVNGVVRQNLLQKGKIRKRLLTEADLPDVTALFFSNAVKGIIPIHKFWINNSYAIDLNTLAVKNAL